jgi:4Fe-4S ferredoxin
MDIEPNKLILKWKFKDIDKKLTYDIEKCIGCSLCKIVCPVDAIEIGPVPEIAQGLMDESNPKIMIDHDKCCYCMLCAVVCPNDAFHEHIVPEGEIDLDEYPHLSRFYEIDEDKCIEDESNEICQLCLDARERNHIKDYHKIQKECPTQCFEINSPLSGEVILKEHMLWKCDPTGCKACVNICPVESFFIPKTAEEVKKFGKIACNEDECFYCGACENSCPDNLIIVERKDVQIEDPKKKGHYPWIEGWVRNIKEIIRQRVIEKEKEQIDIPVILEEVQEAKEEAEEKIPQISEEERQKLLKLNEKIQALLKTKKIRFWVEDGKAEKVGKEVEKVLAQNNA